MQTRNNKITMRQALIIFVMSTLSPAIRLFPNLCSKEGRSAGWTAPIISIPVFFLLFYTLYGFFKDNKYANLGDVFTTCLGKPAGKLVLVFYLIWNTIIYFLYIRYYAERMLTSIYVSTDIRFFILIMTVLTLFSVRGRFETFARFSEFSFLMFSFFFLIFYILLAFSVKPENLLPITHHDIIPAAKAAYPILGIWGYMTYAFFFGDAIVDKPRIKNHAKQCVLFLGGMTLFLLITVTGTLGWRVAQRMSLPFFNTFKAVEAVESFDRFESIILAIWVVADFIVITFFAKVLLGTLKSLFGTAETKYFSTPVVLMGYAGAMYLARNRIELENFSSYVGLPVNILAGLVIPFLVCIIGKIRRKI